MRALRLLLLGDYPADPRLGSPKVLFKLAAEFDQLGHEVSLILRPDLGSRPAQRHARDIVAPVLAERAVTRAVRQGRRFDVIDASSAEGLLIGRRRDLAGAVIARSHGLEHLNYRRMIDDAAARLAPRPAHRRVWYPAVRMPLVRWSAARAERLIVLNESDRDFAAARGWKPADRIDVVPHGISQTFLSPVVSEPRVDDLLFCGSWDRVKGIDYLARAFERTVEQRPSTRLTVLGPGRAPEDVLSLFSPRVRGNVAVHDRVAEESVAWTYRRHKALVFCSTYEGYGMVVPEAMSQKLPVIATPVGAATSLVRHGETGWMVPPRDADALSAAMIRLLDDPVLRRRLAESAYGQAVARSWRVVAEETIGVYGRALAEREAGTL